MLLLVGPRLHGQCEVTNVIGENHVVASRPLDEFPTFVRNSAAVSIVRKVLSVNEQRMSEQVSSRKPFGIATNIRPEKSGDLILRWEKGEGPYPTNKVTVGNDIVEKWKVITSYVAYDHAGNPGKDGRRRVLSKIDILPPRTICTETYLVIGAFETKSEAENLVKYMKTRFFVSLCPNLCTLTISQKMHIVLSQYWMRKRLGMIKCWLIAMILLKMKCFLLQLKSGLLRKHESNIQTVLCAYRTQQL